MSKASALKTRRSTLSHQLVWRTTVLAAGVIIVLSALAALFNFRFLNDNLDTQVLNALTRYPRNVQDITGTTTVTDDLSGLGIIRLDELPTGGPGPDRLFRVVAPIDLSQETQEQLISLPADGVVRTVTIKSLGSYRLAAIRGASPYGSELLTVVGLSLSEITKPLRAQLVVIIVLNVIGIGGVYFATRAIVDRSLRPLTRLQKAATTVSALPLDTGPGTVPVRISESDTDPDTEIGQVGLAFNHMLDHVENALAARYQTETKVRQFVADASHELRNPLASISGYAELTRRNRASLPEDTAHALNRIESESARMSALVEDLLLLARLDSQPTIDRRRIDLSEIVVNAVDDARVADQENQWLLSLEGDETGGSEVFVSANSNQIQQVITNLLANARTHTPPGTTVTTTLRKIAGQAVLEVADNGPGVPEELQPRIFERFVRGDPSRARRAGSSSTGLGLAIVWSVVTAHHGNVTLRSVPGETRVTITLPLSS